MQDYCEISTQQQMDALLNSIAGFHDSMTKEIHLINRGYVLPTHGMVMGHRLDAQVLIQSQWPPYALELLFIEIEEMSMKAPGEYWGARGTVVPGKREVKQTIEMKFDSDLIRSARLFSRVRPDWLGQEARFAREVPSPEAIPSICVRDDWRQCSECCNVWQEGLSQVFAICPDCHALTELRPINSDRAVKDRVDHNCCPSVRIEPREL